MSPEFDRSQHPHRRFNPLTREWLLVSPHRTQRPWQGQVEKTPVARNPEFDPRCYLCPGNERAGGVSNPRYDSTFVFQNDFAALKLDTPAVRIESTELLVMEGEPGTCRVVCFSPRHDLTLALMRVSEIEPVVDTWVGQYRELGQMPVIRHVQIFENRGDMMGASNPHPHCQIWANHRLPNEVVKEQTALLEYRSRHSGCLLCDYLSEERRIGERIVLENDSFTAVVPFWAVWPFEVLLLANRHLGAIDELESVERTALADILNRISITYDNVFEVSFPYSMGFHQRPTDSEAHPEWHFHAHYYPPLLRSATVRKFMVGYELLGMPQRDITPESAAARLRESVGVHYSKR